MSKKHHSKKKAHHKQHHAEHNIFKGPHAKKSVEGFIVTASKTILNSLRKSMKTLGKELMPRKEEALRCVRKASDTDGVKVSLFARHFNLGKSSHHKKDSAEMEDSNWGL